MDPMSWPRIAVLAPTNGRGILNKGNAVRPTILWHSVCVTTVLATMFFGLPGTLAVPAMLATSLLAVRPFIAGAKVRRWLCVIAGVLATWIGVLTMAGGIPHVSVSSRSPDGNVVADVYETDSLVDRHFQVRLTRYLLGIVPIRRVVYHSPDEGARGGERLLWSRDGRHLLLVGPHLFGTADACLFSGDMLYLLVDARTGATASNASQTGLRYPRFSLHDIAFMDFVINLTPGTWDPGLNRCMPGIRNTRFGGRLGQAGRGDTAVQCG
jgi:hypothetical protein